MPKEKSRTNGEQLSIKSFISQKVGLKFLKNLLKKINMLLFILLLARTFPAHASTTENTGTNKEATVQSPVEPYEYQSVILERVVDGDTFYASGKKSDYGVLMLLKKKNLITAKALPL